MTKMFTCPHFSFHSLFLTACSVKSAVLLHPVVIGEREASRGKEEKCSEQNVKDSGEKEFPFLTESSEGKEHLVCFSSVLCRSQLDVFQFVEDAASLHVLPGSARCSQVCDL